MKSAQYRIATEARKGKVFSSFLHASRRSLWGVATLFFILAVSCSGTYDTGLEPAHIQILDEIPEHVLKVENLAIFPGDSEPRYSIELIPVQSFGETGEPYLSRISNAVVDDNDRLIILDVNLESGGFPPPTQLYVFNPDGTLHSKIGRPGSGPGEYLMAGLSGVKGGKVLVIDISNQRLNVYDADNYSLVQTSLFDDWSVQNHEAVKDMRFGFFRPRNDGNLLASFREIVPTSGSRLNLKYILVDLDGNVLDPTPWEFTGGFSFNVNTDPPRPSMLAPPMMGSTVSALTPNDDLYTMWTKDFLIKKYDSDGNYLSAIYYPITGSPFDVEDYVGMFGYTRHNIIRGIEESDESMPTTNPVVASIRIDDENRIWVAVPMNAKQDMYEWWILAPSGELLAKMQRPRNPWFYDIKDGYLYATEIDEETDAQYVVKYRIEFVEAK